MTTTASFILILVFMFAFNAVSFAKKTHSLANSQHGDINAIEAIYASLTDFSAKFVQTTKIALLDKTVTKSGTFKFKKGGKLRIEYDGQDSKTYVSDGTTLWTYIPGDSSSLQTFAVNDETVPKEALSFMNGFGKLKKEFTISKSSAFPGRGDSLTPLHLIPRSKIKYYEYLDVLFGPDHLAQELIIKNTSGNISSYIFTDIKTDQNLPESLFTLSTP